MRHLYDEIEAAAKFLCVLAETGELRAGDGVCGHIEELLSVDAAALWICKRRGMFSTWPEWSGDAVYPVPAPGGAGHMHYYYAGRLWEGRNLTLRLSLLHHIIDECQTRQAALAA